LKAAGVDTVIKYQIKKFGLKTRNVLLQMFNVILNIKETSKKWKIAHNCALLKPGKQSGVTLKNRPILQLCHTYKLFEKLILIRVLPMIIAKSIRQQVGFFGEKSCTR